MISRRKFLAFPLAAISAPRAAVLLPVVAAPAILGQTLVVNGSLTINGAFTKEVLDRVLAELKEAQARAVPGDDCIFIDPRSRQAQVLR